MKVKLNINFEFIAIWLGAVVSALILLGCLIFISKKSAEKFAQRYMNDPHLAEVNLKVPNFEQQEGLDAAEIDAALAGEKVEHATGEPQHEESDVTQAAAWSYVGASGPEYWAQLSQAYAACGEKSQSPIDLPTSAQPDKDLQPIRFLYQDLPGQLLVDSPVLKFKPVAGHSAVIFDETYYLNHIEFRVPSEHQINGVGYDMEIQLFHRNVAGQWAVVSVLAKESRRTHAELKSLLVKLPKRTDRPVDINSLSPEKFLPTIPTYLSYSGSLTSPPCTQRVRWVVMSTPITVSDAQVDALSKYKGFTARPLQELGGRPVDKSWR